jgi:hypothetical protein
MKRTVLCNQSRQTVFASGHALLPNNKTYRYVLMSTPARTVFKKTVTNQLLTLLPESAET